jgi:dienelactone hydrolase
MKYILSLFLFISSIFAQDHQIIEIGPDYYSPAEKIMLSKVKESKHLYQIWPNDGKRADDPAKDLQEKGVVKGILRISNVDRPTLTWVKPEKPDGRAILICPGGGYNILAATHEGSDVASWLAKQGITPFILKYRVPRRKGLEKHKVALEDSQRAMSLIRFHAKSFGIDPNKVGILGFSAGGHLSALTSVQARSYAKIDQADELSCYPNFAVLIYAAYTGDKKTRQLDPLLIETRIIPVYSVIGSKDTNFLPGLDIYIRHLQKNNVPVKHSVYDNIGHGVGLVGTPWEKDCATWLKALKLP